MSTLKPNALVIKSALKKRGSYTIEKHPGLWLASRGDGNGSWRVRYRPPGEKLQRWHTVSNDAKNAEFDEIVRTKDQWLGKVKHDKVDPKAELEAEIAAKKKAEQEDRDTFDRLFNEWIEKHGKLKKKSWPADEKLYARHIKDRMGDKKAAAVKRVDVVAVLDDIAAKVSPIQANRSQAIISAVFAWAMNEGRLESTPAYRIPKRGDEKPRERALTDDELRMLWTATIGVGPVGDAVRFAMVTGQRRSEVAEMPRAELDMNEDDATWIIPGARTKNKLIHRVPLSQAAVAILKAQPAGPMIFAGRAHSGTGSASPNALSRFVERVNLGEPRATFHDLRRTVGTRMAAMGVPKDIRAKVFNHITGARSSVTDSVYNQYDGSAEKRRALELWADRLAEIIEGRKPSGVRWTA